MASGINCRSTLLRPSKWRKKRGYSLIEVVIGSGLSVVALGGASILLIGGMSSWIMGEAKVDAESSSETGVRVISSELRQAMSVTIAPSGNSITYELPATDAKGNYLEPITADGVTRSIGLQGSNLVMTTGNSSHTIVTGVVLSDPLSTGGTGTYKIFTPGVGTIVRQVTIELVTQRNGVMSTLENSRNRETIYIRNVPIISH